MYPSLVEVDRSGIGLYPSSVEVIEFGLYPSSVEVDWLLFGYGPTPRL